MITLDSYVFLFLSLKDYISRHEEKIAEDMIWHILYEITKVITLLEFY